MLTLLASLVGFLFSALPQFLKMWQQNRYDNNKLALLDRQIDAQIRGHSINLVQEADLSTDTVAAAQNILPLIPDQRTPFDDQQSEDTSPPALDKSLSEKQDATTRDKRTECPGWVECLRATVRPVITYAFFILFAAVKLISLFKLLEQGVDITDSLVAVWDTDTQALFSAVVSFWFGQRALNKLQSRL